MIWFLWILIGLAVGLVIFAFFSSEGSRQENPESNFQNKTEDALRQLKDRVFFLENESKKANQLCLSIKQDLSNLKEKDLSLIINLLKGKQAFRQREGSSGQEGLRFTEYEKTIELLKKEIEELSHKLIELALKIKRLEGEGERKDRLIGELKKKEAQLIRLLEEVKLRLRKVVKELSETKTRELKIRADLFKEKAVYLDSEKELKQLTKENEQLRDGLSYELHN